MNLCQCRLLIVGPTKDLKAFANQEEWPVGFTEIEPLELSPTRRSWQFTVPKPPLFYLRLLAARWPRLALVVDYDTGRIKGLAMLRQGGFQDHQVVYQPLP